jgi:hypothetical protein
MAKKRQAVGLSSTKRKRIAIELSSEGVLEAIQTLHDREHDEYLKLLETVRDREVSGGYVVLRVDELKREIVQEYLPYFRQLFLAKCDIAFLQNVIAAYRITLSGRNRPTPPGKLALLRQIDESECKPRKWKAIYSKWSEIEPSLKAWCLNFKSLRAEIGKARRNGFRPARAKLKPIPTEDRVPFPDGLRPPDTERPAVGYGRPGE